MNHLIAIIPSNTANDEWLETSKTIDIFLDSLKCIAMPRNEKGEVVSKVTVELE